MASSTTSSSGPIITVPYADCTLETCPIAAAQLVYDPNLAGNVLYLAIFSFCLLLNLLLGLWYRTWGYMVAMVIGCVLEILGYVGRVQMHFNPFPQNPFLLYLICVTIASIFFTAAIYLCFSRIVVVFGEDLSIVKARTYTILFIICDFISLLLQAGGGTMVSLADDLSFSQKGVHVTQAGLIFQVTGLVVFMMLCAIFASACIRNKDRLDDRFLMLRNSRRFRTLLWTLSLATIFMLIRCSFRVAELSSGFKGPIWYNEVDYMVLEGAMISICVLLLTLMHPGFGFSGQFREANFTIREKKAKHQRQDRGTEHYS